MAEPEGVIAKHKQTVTKDEIKAAISAAEVFDLDETRVYNFDDIPRDEVLFDHVFGMLELARIEKMIKPSQLKQFNLVYTQHGLPRSDRQFGVGRAFKDLEGNAVKFNDKYLRGDEEEELELGKYEIPPNTSTHEEDQEMVRKMMDGAARVGLDAITAITTEAENMAEVIMEYNDDGADYLLGLYEHRPTKRDREYSAGQGKPQAAE
jgi:hypothetical protein